jgi:hypothetical protein
MAHIPFDLTKIIASYITENVYKPHDWLPLNREDWASRLSNNMLATIDGNIQRYKANGKYEKLVNAMIKSNEDYWCFTLTDKNQDVKYVKIFIEKVSSDLISGRYEQESYLYSYPDIKNNPMFANLLSLNVNLRRIDKEATYAKIIQKAQEIDLLL